MGKKIPSREKRERKPRITGHQIWCGFFLKANKNKIFPAHSLCVVSNSVCRGTLWSVRVNLISICTKHSLGRWLRFKWAEIISTKMDWKAKFYCAQFRFGQLKESRKKVQLEERSSANWRSQLKKLGSCAGKLLSFLWAFFYRPPFGELQHQNRKLKLMFQKWWP